MGLIVPFYGKAQPTAIRVPALIAYRETEREEGPWVMPPYATFYPPPPEPVSTRALVPPPLFKTDLWSAMQTWPL